MNSTSKKNRMNSSSSRSLHVVDKLPSLRGEGYFKRAGISTGSASNREDQSMATDRAKHNEDETTYTLDEKSTIEEESDADDHRDAVNDINDDGISKDGTCRTDDGDDDAFTTTTTRTNTTGMYLQDRDVMSMSANSSANFSFFPSGQESMDAYPALYAPDTQAAYEKMKVEEEERKYQEAKWEPVQNAIEFFKSGVSRMLAYLERICANGAKK